VNHVVQEIKASGTTSVIGFQVTGYPTIIGFQLQKRDILGSYIIKIKPNNIVFEQVLSIWISKDNSGELR
jgi:hypothetical protein